MSSLNALLKAKSGHTRAEDILKGEFSASCEGVGVEYADGRCSVAPGSFEGKTLDALKAAPKRVKGGLNAAKVTEGECEVAVRHQ